MYIIQCTCTCIYIRVMWCVCVCVCVCVCEFLPFCRGTGSLLVRTVHMLQSLRLTYPDLCLLVPGILCKLLQGHRSQEDTGTLSADSHLVCWSYEDTQQGREKEDGGHRSIAYDGKFVYVTSFSLKRLLKIGTGRHGTLR